MKFCDKKWAMKTFLQGLRDPDMRPAALKVALIVGTVLFSINHGKAFIEGNMNRARWISSVLTYVVPYCVNIHGQVSNQRKQQLQQPIKPETNKKTCSQEQATALKQLWSNSLFCLNVIVSTWVSRLFGF